MRSLFYCDCIAGIEAFDGYCYTSTVATRLCNHFHISINFRQMSSLPHLSTNKNVFHVFFASFFVVAIFQHIVNSHSSFITIIIGIMIIILISLTFSLCFCILTVAILWFPELL